MGRSFGKVFLLLTLLMFGVFLSQQSSASAATGSIETGGDMLKKGNMVYMGNEGVSDPLPWNVISDQTNMDTSGRLLMAPEILDSVKYNSELSKKNVWQGSTLQKWCKDYFNAKFTAAERNAVILTTKKDPEYDPNIYTHTLESALSDDSLFVLSAEEADKYLESDESKKPLNWWMRSPGYDKVNEYDNEEDRYENGQIACFVFYDGFTYVVSIFSAHGVRPAFNLDLSDVLYASPARAGKNFGEELTAVPDYDGTEWKLTLIDSSRSQFNADILYYNESFYITYSGAGTGDGEYISAMLCDESGAKYFASVRPDEGGNGTWILKEPTGIATGKYTIKVFSEKRNDDLKTDYASSPKELEVEIVVGGGSEYEGDIKTGRSVILGTQRIDDPLPVGNGGEWSYVYYGKHDDNPVKYRVLQKCTTAYSGTTGKKTMFLDCDSSLFCDALMTLNLNYQFYNKPGVFTDREKSAIIDSRKEAGKTIVESAELRWYLYGMSLNGEKTFLLEAADVSNPFYGYVNDNNRYKDGCENWWLRSTSSYSSEARGCVCNGGINWMMSWYGRDRMGYLIGVSPAFNVDLEQILFTSAAAGGKPYNAGMGEFSEINEYNGKEWKLTLLDYERNGFTANISSNTVAPAGKLTVSYSGAKTGEGEYVSAMLYDATGVNYYASIIPDESGSGDWILKMPYDIARGRYTLLVFSENQNGDYLTDYASPFRKFELMVEGEPVEDDDADPAESEQDGSKSPDGKADAKSGSETGSDEAVDPPAKADEKNKPQAVSGETVDTLAKAGVASGAAIDTESGAGSDVATAFSKGRVAFVIGIAALAAFALIACGTVVFKKRKNRE